MYCYVRLNNAICWAEVKFQLGHLPRAKRPNPSVKKKYLRTLCSVFFEWAQGDDKVLQLERTISNISYNSNNNNKSVSWFGWGITQSHVTW